MAPAGWEALRADERVQFEPVAPTAPKEDPQWLQDLYAALGRFFEPIALWLVGNWHWLRWVFLALAALALAWLVWRLLLPLLEREPKREEAAADDWTPARADAIALLEEADRLAAEGAYDAATHLLLTRSVRQIADRRPELVEPSSTARELAALAALPEAARDAFGTIAARVERSLFALRRLAREDWQAARDAYARFAQVPL